MIDLHGMISIPYLKKIVLPAAIAACAICCKSRSGKKR